MKILMITPEFPPLCGGIGWYVYYLSMEMASRGHRVTILQRGPDDRSHSEPFTVHYMDVGVVPLLNAVKMIRRTRKFLQKEPQDVAIVHSTTIGTWLKDIPTILLSHSLFAEAWKCIYGSGRDLNSLLHVLFSRVYIETERRSIQGADIVGVVSHAMKEEIRRHYGKNADYVGNAVDTDTFQPALGRNGRGVLLPSLLRPGKGIPEAVKVMKMLRDRGCDIPFRFIDKGSMKKELVKGIAKYNLSGIQWLAPGDHKKLSELYQSSSIVFLPSAYEGLPNVCLEAMACGLPVVATDVGGTREAVIHDQTGYIHHSQDVAGMAESIHRLDQSESLRKNLGQNGLQLIYEQFTWKRVGDRWQALLTNSS